jgi:hypothetical protein
MKNTIYFEETENTGADLLNNQQKILSCLQSNSPKMR